MIWHICNSKHSISSSDAQKWFLLWKLSNLYTNAIIPDSLARPCRRCDVRDVTKPFNPPPPYVTHRHDIVNPSPLGAWRHLWTTPHYCSDWWPHVETLTKLLRPCQSLQLSLDARNKRTGFCSGQLDDINNCLCDR